MVPVGGLVSELDSDAIQSILHGPHTTCLLTDFGILNSIACRILNSKAVEASWTAAPDPLVPARASADASSSKEAELLLTLRLVAGVVTTGV